MQTLSTRLKPQDLSRFRIGYTNPAGVRTVRVFSHDGNNAFVEQPAGAPIVAPTEPDGSDLRPNAPLPPAPPTITQIFLAWLQTDAGRLISFQTNTKQMLEETFAAGFRAALDAMEAAK